MASEIVDPNFPAGALVPKTETGALNFLQKYPEFDGRNVTIAIFDSGVDPRASGLQTTPDGAVKVIERFDCSGTGDTDMTKKVTVSADGHIAGLSGRSLKVTPEMLASNKDGGEFRVGLKSLYDLYPSKIRENVAKNLKLKQWDEPHKIATAEVARELHNFEAQHSDSSTLALKDKLKKEDLENSLEFLNGFEKKYLTIKTTYDCVLYKSADGWKAVIDTTETGDLQNAVHIEEYSKTHVVKNVDDFLSISINVHDEGNVLEIVGMCSSHGTHVASIASGNHSDKDVDGVAPHAKIVSLTIGDGRLGSMETGTALVRAMTKVMELCNTGTKIDVINMSYGEHAHWSNTGRIGELMNEVVNKYGIVWVASAGNHGPALCTIGTPPDISQPSCIGVGAYVSPQMMEAEYALRERLPANVYTWTSRDPCIDGGQGVTVCAPGAAITSVPEFTMSKAQLMNGTSMAAPHVAGAIALLVSGLKQKAVRYSPFSIKRSICATANKLSYVDPFAQGSGLLNVEKAFEHLLQHADQPENLVRFNVTVDKYNAKGIHLRSGELKKPSEHSVSIEPVFLNDTTVAPKDKINFNVRLNLISSQPWVQCGAFLDLCYSARSIAVKVDPVGLPVGVHQAVIKAYDTSRVEKGALFEIPITVVQPQVLRVEKPLLVQPAGPVEFKPNTIRRDFVLVPNHATWAVLRLKLADTNEKKTGKFYIHTMQLLPQRYCKACENQKLLAVDSQTETVYAFKCVENNILEVCIAKYWSNFGDTQLNYSLEFHGIRAVTENAFRMVPANGIHRLNVTSLGSEEIQPSIQLKTAAVVLKPTEAKISPLSPIRDVIPAGRQIYQNLLTYNLHVSKAQEIALYVPLMSGILYESEYESQFWMLFDSNKMMVTCGDAYTNTSYTKLEKGDYSVRLQVRHEKKELLEKISDANMVALFKLSSALSLDVYEQYNQAVVGGKKFASCVLNSSVDKCLYVSPLTNEKLTKASLPSGSAWLTGAIVLAKDENGRKVDGYQFDYVLSESPANGSKKSNGSASASAGNGSGNGNGSPKKAKTSLDEYKEGLRDFQCSMLTKLELEKAEEVYAEIVAAHPKYLNAHLLLIQALESTDPKLNQYPLSFHKYLKAEGVADENKPNVEKLSSVLKRIITLADLVINETDKNALLAYLGLKTDTRSDAAKIKITMDKQKSALLESYAKKGIALCKLQLIEQDKDAEIKSSVSERLVEINDIYTEILKYSDATDTKIINFAIYHAYENGQFGRMTKLLQKIYDDKLSRDVLEELSLIAAEKKWPHVQNIIQKIAVSANPLSYRLF